MISFNTFFVSSIVLGLYQLFLKWLYFVITVTIDLSDGWVRREAGRWSSQIEGGYFQLQISTYQRGHPRMGFAAAIPNNRHWAVHPQAAF